MTNFKKQFVSVIAGSAMLLQVAAPAAFADTNLTISGNGTNSDSDVHVSNTSTNTILQSNTANVVNTVNANVDTGNNSANKNTNGDVKVISGDATVNSTVKNTLNSNVAQAGCNCGQGDTTVKVDGNGSNSDNTVKLNNNSTNQITQDNNANVVNNVDAKANTGKNEANKNTGGDVTVISGDAHVTSNVTTNANANVAQLGGNGGHGSDVSAIISGNGTDSDNDIKLTFKDKNNIWQANSANVVNDVDASAKTGSNDANKNTGGDTTVWSGDAGVMAGITNNVNFNSAALDCGCAENDVTAKVTGNGYNSDNYLSAKFDSDNGVYQGGEKYGNDANLINDIKPTAKTGKNDANDNTGPAGTDPVKVYSGDASAIQSITNSGNSNSFGTPVEMPTGFDFGGLHFNFNFSFGN